MLCNAIALDMAQKTIYLPDSALPTWELAQQDLNESMSVIFMDCLNKKLAAHRRLLEMKKTGMQRIVVSVRDENDNIRRQAFMGRWIVKDLGDHIDANGMFSVALTEKGALAVYSETIESLDVFDSFDELKNPKDGFGKVYPNSVLACVAATLDEDFVEDLDI